ncbi:MAG: hypothetical protein M1524_04025 [Patescibacteria group bacterium]|nr:hypothetical protein [Patescibacteria group bacterium]
MSQKIIIDQNLLKILYIRYKPYLIYGGIIIVCLVIFLKVLIPQVYDFFAARDEVEQLRTRVNTLNQNINLLSSLSDSDLESDLNITALALPPEKDFAGILNAIKQASAKSGAVVGDYSFSIGEISGKTKDVKKHPSIEVNLSLKNNIRTTQNFLNEIYKILPLSEVSAIDVSGNSANITLLFYYKQLPKIQYNKNMNMKALSNQDTALLEDLSSWKISDSQDSSLTE